MVLNAAVQMLREADELKQKILKFKSGTSMLQERSLWVTQQQLQKLYQKVLVLDLDYALDKKVEQDLWNIGFKQQIEALQAISKDKKNPLRSEGQAMLSWVLQAAAGFYLCLLHQICTTFKLDLPFRRRASLLGWVEGWGAGEAAAGARLPPPAAARYICQHCLVHLGDLARYRQQLRVAHTFYRHALVVSAHSGQPYNQLALVAWRRGRRLAAIYWHVRSLLVRAPFPPAPNNLARTLAAAAASRDIKELPVLGESPPATPPPVACATSRLDAHSYVNELIRVMHIIHTVEQLDTATELVDSLNSSLTALVATDSFDSLTLIKMACVIIWLVHSTTEELALDSSSLTESEAAAAHLSQSLAAGALLALLLPAYTVSSPLHRALPAVCVWIQWWCAHTQVCRGAAWAARPQLWPALAHTLNTITETLEGFHGDKYDTVPLPEDEELVGFTPLEAAHKELQFPNHAAWETYGGRVPTVEGEMQSSIEISSTCLSSSPELERKVRVHRLIQLGKRLAQLSSEHLTYTEEEGKVSFSATCTGGEQLSRALAELRLAASRNDDTRSAEAENVEQPPAPPPPVIISEADFREKVLCAVREKRVGILKPQGSLERAREERAHATSHDTQESAASEEDNNKGDDKKDSRKPRVNIAMAAIMRKQEEINKQVKFVTPPLTPDSTTDSTESQSTDKPKIIQPKAIKSLANLPIGKKTGGILSLKDKSAGYPHLVNADPEPPKKPNEEKKEAKQQTPPAQYQKKQDGGHQTSPTWGPNYNDSVRANFQKHYGIQNTGISYNPNYPPPGVNNQGIRLPVVNPKEIDVRTAAIQKQNSRQDLFQDGNKIMNNNYQISGDKKNFLNDLPPRFANQYRYWHNAQENQFNDNKFRDDNFKANFNQPPPQPPRGNWMSPGQSENLTMPWWKPENQPNFSNFTAAPMNVPNFYTPQLNPNLVYPSVQYNQMQNQNVGQQKSELNYLQPAIGQPQLQTLQNLVTSPNFNSSLNSLSSFPPTVTYDSSMYPQFNNKMSYPPPQMKMPEKPQGFEGNNELMNIGNRSFGSNASVLQQRNLGTNLNFSMNNDPLNNDMGTAKNLDQTRLGEVSPAASALSAGNTYSLFSGTAEAPAWAAHQQHQSLWSGPGPSPLERLLEQQKQMKQPPAPH